MSETANRTYPDLVTPSIPLPPTPIPQPPPAGSTSPWAINNNKEVTQDSGSLSSGQGTASITILASHSQIERKKKDIPQRETR